MLSYIHIRFHLISSTLIPFADLCKVKGQQAKPTWSTVFLIININTLNLTKQFLRIEA
jgi:hypothetical protein